MIDDIDARQMEQSEYQRVKSQDFIEPGRAAEKCLQEALKHSRLAESYIRDLKYDKALLHLRIALELNPVLHDCYYT
ncbi:MAG: hypothetical protein LCH63_17795 [Candidatus Melainabacteria bacterium]|nr:hypothetical protein [Candidatus Melainabacteria bacterium]